MLEIKEIKTIEDFVKLERQIHKNPLKFINKAVVFERTSQENIPLDSPVLIITSILSIEISAVSTMLFCQSAQGIITYVFQNTTPDYRLIKIEIPGVME